MSFNATSSSENNFIAEMFAFTVFMLKHLIAHIKVEL